MQQQTTRITRWGLFNAGPIAESWRQQTGSPSYCTEVTLADLPEALASADLARSRRQSDLASKVYSERFNAGHNPGGDFIIQLSRLLYAV